MKKIQDSVNLQIEQEEDKSQDALGGSKTALNILFPAASGDLSESLYIEPSYSFGD